MKTSRLTFAIYFNGFRRKSQIIKILPNYRALARDITFNLKSLPKQQDEKEKKQDCCCSQFGAKTTDFRDVSLEKIFMKQLDWKFVKNE